MLEAWGKISRWLSEAAPPNEWGKNRLNPTSLAEVLTVIRKTCYSGAKVAHVAADRHLNLPQWLYKDVGNFKLLRVAISGRLQEVKRGRVDQSMLKIEISASAVAWYAAIVASVSATVSIYNAWRDRARLRFGFSPNMLVSGKEPTKFFLITVANCGRRPIFVSHLALGERRKIPLFLLKDSVAVRELLEGKSTQYIVDQDPDFSRYKWVSISDSTGRSHWRKIPRKILERLREPQV